MLWTMRLFSNERKIEDVFIRNIEKCAGEIADLAKATQAYDGDVLEKDGLHMNGQGRLILCKLLLELPP